MIDPKDEMRIKVPRDKELRELVQKKLFILGFGWVSPPFQKIYGGWDSSYIFLNSFVTGSLTHGGRVLGEEIEISLYDLFENLPSLSEREKQPYITDSGNVISRETINNLLKEK